MAATNSKHEALYQEVLAVVRKYDLPSIEILAVLSNMVGKVLAMQDQTAGSADFYMNVVRRNIELGNKQMVEDLMGNTAGQA